MLGVSVLPIGSVLPRLEEGAPVLTGPIVLDRCYITFTSCTTGAPNDVQVTHVNVANVLLTLSMDLGVVLASRLARYSVFHSTLSLGASWLLDVRQQCDRRPSHWAVCCTAPLCLFVTGALPTLSS